MPCKDQFLKFFNGSPVFNCPASFFQHFVHPTQRHNSCGSFLLTAFADFYICILDYLSLLILKCPNVQY